MENLSIRTYTVAGISFTLEMAADGPLWRFMDKYAPFLADVDTQPHFRVRLVDRIPFERKERVYEETDPRMPRLEAYVSGHRAFFRVAPLRDSQVEGEALVDVTARRTVFTVLDTDPRTGFVVDNVLMLSFALLGADQDALLLHASCVVKDAAGYLFLGISGTGKSTHSRLWMEHLRDVQLLNDDNPVARVEGEDVFVYGSPWSGKTPCYRNERARLGGIVSLEQAPRNRIRRQTVPRAYADVFSSSSALRLSQEMSDQIHRTIASIVTRVPVFHLECLPDSQAALLCAQNLIRT